MLQLDIGKTYVDKNDQIVIILSAEPIDQNGDISIVYRGDNNNLYRTDGVVLKYNHDDDIGSSLVDLVSEYKPEQAPSITSAPPKATFQEVSLKVGRLYLDQNNTLVHIQHVRDSFVEGIGYNSTTPLYQASNGCAYFANGHQYRSYLSSDASPLSYLLKEVPVSDLTIKPPVNETIAEPTLQVQVGKTYRSKTGESVEIMSKNMMLDQPSFAGSDGRLYYGDGVECKRFDKDKSGELSVLIEEVEIKQEPISDPLSVPQDPVLTIQVGKTYIDEYGELVGIRRVELLPMDNVTLVIYVGTIVKDQESYQYLYANSGRGIDVIDKFKGNVKAPDLLYPYHETQDEA